MLRLWLVSARAPTWQALAGDDVQDFLHQDEALAGREVRDSTAGKGKALGGRGGGMLRLELDELRPSAPEIRRAVGHRDLVDRGHGRRGRDRVGAGAIADPGLDVSDGFRAVDDCRNAWKFGRRGIRHVVRFTQCSQLAGQCASVKVLEQSAANPAGDRLALLVRMPVGGEHGDPLRGDSVAQCSDYGPPSAGHVRIEQHDIRAGGRSLACRSLRGSRLGDDRETMTREVIAESLGCRAVLTDDEQSAQRQIGVDEH